LGGYGLALAALALVVFGAIECPPTLPPRSYVVNSRNNENYYEKIILFYGKHETKVEHEK